MRAKKIGNKMVEVKPKLAHAGILEDFISYLCCFLPCKYPQIT